MTICQRSGQGTHIRLRRNPRWRLVCGILLVIASTVSYREIHALEPGQWAVEWKLNQFQIHSDFKLDSPQMLMDELKAITRDIELLLGEPPSDAPVHIVLFGSVQEYSRYMKTYFPNLPQRRALFIQDRGPGMLFTHWHEEVTVDLRHEVTHALLNNSSHHLPLWLDEGLAEYYEVAASQRFEGNIHLQDILQRSQQGYVPSLKQLEDMHEQVTFGDSHYRDSWSWIHFLLHRNAETRALLVRYIQDYRSGTRPLPLSRQLVKSFPDLNREYQQHFASLNLP
ncbi:MAG: hypothetical protein R3C53_05240 [Pirellulaceae bacterium]